MIGTIFRVVFARNFKAWGAIVGGTITGVILEYTGVDLTACFDAASAVPWNDVLMAVGGVVGAWFAPKNRD